MNKKILITGASGFIGSHCIEEALRCSLTPVCFDRYIHEYPEGCKRFQGDIRDFEAVNEAVAKVDYAINLAGILGTQETIDNPIPSIQTNIIGALNFLKACKPTKFHQVRAVQIGVGNYYENNSYSISKSTAIRFCQMYNKEHKTKVAMVRGLNAYGPRQKHKPVRKIIPTFVVRALRGENIEIYGGKDNCGRMDMIYVKDLVKILVEVCLRDDVDYSKIYEAGTGVVYKVWDIAERIVEFTKSKSKIVEVPMRPGETLKTTVVAQNPYPIDYTLFEEGIKTTVKWYKEHYDWKIK